MQINFEKAKDGNDTCKIDNIYLHSAYSPIKEAERFAETISSPFIPEIIFVIEPGISYCADFLRKKFSRTSSTSPSNTPQIIVIRLCDSFKKYDNLFDSAINYFEYKSSDNFESDLFNRFGEEKLSYSIFQIWEPAGKIFKTEVIELFNSIKNVINKSHSVLATRSFFEKRWLMNSVRIALTFQKNVSLVKNGNCPIIIAASGPSLKSAIPILKSLNRNNAVFIISVSSAINPLIENDIIPDLCISTDGGYWAKTHLKSLRKISDKTIFALAAEGNCNIKLIQNSTILPLSYPDGIESEILKLIGGKSFPALRCGTVSGTALDLAMQLTTGDIYFCGLDLSLSNGFQHTQNNLIEKTNEIFDTKINSSEKRISVSGFSNQKASLKIYEDWFKNFLIQNKNIFRVIENPKNSLGKIKDISVNEFEAQLKNDKSTVKPTFTDNLEIEKNTRISKIKDFIQKNSNTDRWLYNCFPTEYLNYTHNYDENQREGVYKKILSENEMLVCKIEKLCGQFTKK